MSYGYNYNYKSSVESFEQKKIINNDYSVYRGPIKEDCQPAIIKTHNKHELHTDVLPIKYPDKTDPKVWGRPFWFTLHNGAASYPVNASPYVVQRMMGFILGIPVMLPCEKCKVHATNHIEKMREYLRDICSGREKLFKFFVDFHNMVNKRHDKPIVSYDDAWELYSN